MNAAERALSTFRTPPYCHTCAQTICAAFGREDLLDAMKPLGGGRAPEGICGSLHAACTLAPEHAEELKAGFREANGAIRCADLRVLHVPCQTCVRTSATLLEKVLGIRD